MNKLYLYLLSIIGVIYLLLLGYLFNKQYNFYLIL